MYKSGMLATDIPLYEVVVDAYGAVPPDAAAIWWAYAAAVTLVVLDGMLYWHTHPAGVAGFGTHYHQTGERCQKP